MKIESISPESLRRYIPNILAEAEGETPLFDKLEPFLQSARMWLEAEYLGEDDFLSDSHTQLALKIIVRKAFADAIPALDIVITPAGMAVISTDNMAPASKERVERLLASLDHYITANLDLLLDICRTYPQWRQSERGRYFGASFINSPRIIRAGNLDLTFEEARRRALIVESDLAERFLGRKTLDRIRSDFNDNSTTAAPVADMIAAAILKLISPDNFVIDQNRLWHAARPIINELRYYPEYHKLWAAEMDEDFRPEAFVNDIKGGFYF